MEKEASGNDTAHLSRGDRISSFSLCDNLSIVPVNPHRKDLERRKSL